MLTIQQKEKIVFILEEYSHLAYRKGEDSISDEIDALIQALNQDIVESQINPETDEPEVD